MTHVAPAGSGSSAQVTKFPVAMHEPAPVATPVTTNGVGTVSVTTTLRAASGPAFVTVIVYVKASPGSTGSVESIFVMESSATMDVTASLSVAVLFAAFVSPMGEAVIEAVFTSVADG